MRLHFAIPVAAVGLALVGRPADAQYAPVRAFTIAGCVDGVVRIDVVNGIAQDVLGRVGCFSGTAELEALGPLPGPSPFTQLRMVGAISAAFSNEFAGSRVVGQFIFPLVGSTPAGEVLNVSLFTEPNGLPSVWNVGDSSPAPFRTFYELLVGPQALESFAPGGPVRVALSYRLPGDFGGSGAAGTFTLSAVPEPATVALLGVGLLAAGAGARWRRRAD